jgi:Mce-associated membrane protein
VTVKIDEHIEAETIDETPTETAGTEDHIAAEAIEETSTETGAAQASDDVDPTGSAPSEGGRRWVRVLAFGVLPAIVLTLGLAVGYAKWLDSSLRDAHLARAESVRAATESTIAMLSYKPDTVDKDLTVARERLTGNFRDAYTKLTHDVVIPGFRRPNHHLRRRTAHQHRLECPGDAGQSR